MFRKGSDDTFIPRNVFLLLQLLQPIPLLCKSKTTSVYVRSVGLQDATAFRLSFQHSLAASSSKAQGIQEVKNANG